MTGALDRSVLRAARQVALVVGAGALGAALCSTGVRMSGPGSEQTLPLQPAGGAAQSTPRVLDDAERRALDVLRRASVAERTLSYSGTKYLSGHSSSGNTAVMAELRHRPGVGTWVRTSGAGEPAPEDRPGAGVGRLVGPESSSDLEPRALAALTGRYALALAGTSVCAGRRATVVEARDLGSRQVAARFWVADDSGLLLRRELYDEERRTVRATAFVDLTVGPAAAAPGPEPSTPSGRPAGRLLGAGDLDRLRADGWHLPTELPGGLVLHAAKRMTMAGQTVVQLSFSDGLFTASLFAQHGRLDAGRLTGFRPERLAGTEAWTRPGLYRQTVWTGGGTVWTLVTDAPDQRVERLVSSLPRTAPDEAMLSRVGRGIGRVGSWANPFD